VLLLLLDGPSTAALSASTPTVFVVCNGDGAVLVLHLAGEDLIDAEYQSKRVP
jgi:hypothetical protein